MALKATIHKATVNIADMDRHYYSEANLVLAQHPSETPQRLMLRLLAWLCHADDCLEFTRGLSAEDEPALWLRNDHGEVQWWIELGLPDEKRLRKACQVVLYAIMRVPLAFGGSKTNRFCLRMGICRYGLSTTGS